MTKLDKVVWAKIETMGRFSLMHGTTPNLNASGVSSGHFETDVNTDELQNATGWVIHFIAKIKSN